MIHIKFFVKFWGKMDENEILWTKDIRQTFRCTLFNIPNFITYKQLYIVCNLLSNLGVKRKIAFLSAW